MFEDADERLVESFGRFYPKGSILFRDGDPGDEMFIIYKGRVKISKTVGERQKTLAILRKGDFFGEIAVLTHRPRTADALALDESTMLVFDGKTLDTFLRKKSEVAVRMLRKMAERLADTDDQIESLLIEDSQIKTLHMLIKLVPEDWPPDSPFLLDPQEFLTLVGIDIEELKGLLTRFRKMELIDIVGRNISIPNIAKLQRFREFLEMQREFHPKGGRAEGEVELFTSEVRGS